MGPACKLGCFTWLLCSSVLTASDPVGIYALVDRVVLEPDGAEPERAQIWGAFSIATGPGLGDTYFPPERGYLYYELDPQNPKASRIEWQDLVRVAGQDTCVGFGSRYLAAGRVRPGCEPPSAPDVHPVAMGLTKLNTDPSYQPLRDLLSLPRPVSPTDGAAPPAAEVTSLTARNILAAGHSGAIYHFELRRANGQLIAEEDITAGETRTTWTLPVRLEAGHTFTWRVHATEGDWSGLTATACFSIPFLRGDPNGDGAADISDAVAILSHLFSGGGVPTPLESGDVDSNSVLELTDAVYLLLFLFQGGPAPPPPYPSPGLLSGEG